MCSCINFVPDFHFAGYEFWTICFNILHIKVLVCSLHPFTARGEKRSESNSTKYTFFRFLTDGSFTLSYFLGIGFHYRLPIPRCHRKGIRESANILGIYLCLSLLFFPVSILFLYPDTRRVSMPCQVLAGEIGEALHIIKLRLSTVVCYLLTSSILSFIFLFSFFDMYIVTSSKLTLKCG